MLWIFVFPMYISARNLLEFVLQYNLVSSLCLYIEKGIKKSHRINLFMVCVSQDGYSRMRHLPFSSAAVAAPWVHYVDLWPPLSDTGLPEHAVCLRRRRILTLNTLRTFRDSSLTAHRCLFCACVRVCCTCKWEDCCMNTSVLQVHVQVCDCTVYVYICVCAEGRWDGAWNPHSAAQSGKHLGLLSKQPCAVLHGCPCKQFGILERHWSYSMWPVQGYAVYICVHHIQYPAANSLCCYFIHCLCCYMSSKLLKCLNAQMVSH